MRQQYSFCEFSPLATVYSGKRTAQKIGEKMADLYVKSDVELQTSLAFTKSLNCCAVSALAYG